jgi:hypothetical protein
MTLSLSLSLDLDLDGRVIRSLVWVSLGCLVGFG